MAFTIVRQGFEKIDIPQFRAAYLYSYTKPPDTLQSNWLLTSVGMTGDGERGKHFEFTLSGALFKEDADTLKSFGELKGNDVVLTLVFRDVPVYEELNF